MGCISVVSGNRTLGEFGFVRRRAWVFFIDDAVDLRYANERTLNLAGFETELFACAEEALAAFSRRLPAGSTGGDI